MGTTFNFASYGNSQQNNTVIMNNNDIDKILELLKEINFSQQQIDELKLAIENDITEVNITKSLGTNVKNWCNNLFNQITTNAILNITLPVVQSKLQTVLYAIYHFPIRF